MIFTFNRYSKKSYIIKLLKNDNISWGGNESYESIANNILKVDNINNYKKYIHYIYLYKFSSFLDDDNDNCKEGDNFEVEISKKTCFIHLALIIFQTMLIIVKFINEFYEVY